MFKYRAICVPEWTDYNGHMNDALYGRVFSDAIDAMMVEVGLDEAYREETKGTIYTMEDHRWYEWEVHEGAELLVETYLVDFDAKRMHIWQGLFVGDQRCAACETMLMHISQAGETPKSAPMPDVILEVLAQHKTDEELSPRAGSVGIKKKSTGALE